MRGFSDLAGRLQGQEMFQILKRAKEFEARGKSIIHFELGDPDFDTPKDIINACYDSLRKGFTHYAPSSGLLELKVAAADSTERGRRKFRPELSQLLVTPGANIQIDLAISCTTNPGEEIIVPDPGFVSYFSIINARGVKSVRVPVYEKNEFRLNPKDVEEKITDKTKMIIINSPNNPLGAVMTPEEIKQIYDIVKRHDLWLLSDEIYTRLIYDDVEFSSPSIYDHCKERTIIVNGFSKSHAMTGWRIGVMTAPEDLTEKAGLLLETSLSCVSPFIQKAAIEALSGNGLHSEVMVKEYKKRRDLIVEGLNSLPKISCLKPQGAFYVFPNIKETGMTSRDFADLMMEKAGVALTPGPIFGNYGEGYVRLSYANSIENIEKGVERMRIVLSH